MIAGQLDVLGEIPVGRSWLIRLPPGLPLLNPNKRDHWSKDHAVRKELTKAALQMVRAARVPQLDRVTVLVVYDPPPDWRNRDTDNLGLTGKAVIDALRPPFIKVGKKWVRAPRAGYVLPEDDSSHVLSTTYRIGPDYPLGRLRMIIREVPDGWAAG